ncbi:DUF4907 domain-containing protein [Chitinophaga pendula]|uniref:DUF4907 domain-containing protein n=1 Tax=Chitinophaga TaxID=79328 RepID=UPI0012FDBD18|nr:MULTISPECIES: DUF4907 domain-containing protein [Chitinophaga]UCJ05549.1 DUF4907 domain-containing protein [Chitinophaga pendula]
MIAGLLLLATILFQGWQRQQSAPAKMAVTGNIRLEPYAIGAGWGYRVYVNDRRFINQDQVPALSGKHVFANRDEAMRVGNLVVEKIRHQELPYVTIAELQALQVSAAVKE